MKAVQAMVVSLVSLVYSLVSVTEVFQFIGAACAAVTGLVAVYRTFWYKR